MKKEGSCIRSAGEFLAREPRIRDDREGKREVNNELRLTPFLEPNSPPSKRPRADVIGIHDYRMGRQLVQNVL